MEKWFGKVAVVTGASSGIGAQIAKDLASNGLIAIGLARRPERVDELMKEIGETSGKIYSYKCDVSDLQSIKDAFKWIEDKFGEVNILVNNAAILRNVNILGTEPDVPEQLQQVIQTNFTGLINTTRESYRLMQKSDDFGLIVNISSLSGHIVPFMETFPLNVYPGTKHALRATAEVLRQELIIKNDHKVRISTISPGGVSTEILKTSGHVESTEHDFFQSIPHLKPRDVSQAVEFLMMTPYSVNITEITIRSVGERF